MNFAGETGDNKRHTCDVLLAIENKSWEVWTGCHAFGHNLWLVLYETCDLGPGCHMSDLKYLLLNCHLSPVVYKGCFTGDATSSSFYAPKGRLQFKILVVFTTKALVVQNHQKKSQNCLVVGRTQVKKSQKT